MLTWCKHFLLNNDAFNRSLDGQFTQRLQQVVFLTFDFYKAFEFTDFCIIRPSFYVIDLGYRQKALHQAQQDLSTFMAAVHNQRQFFQMTVLFQSVNQFNAIVIQALQKLKKWNLAHLLVTYLLA
jgi:hypothetical protein